MAEVAALTLENISLDVQIVICMFLHPLDILALREVCRHQKLSLLQIISGVLSRLVKFFKLPHGDV